jgi:hypothetical protein
MKGALLLSILFLCKYFVNSSINYNNNVNYNLLRLRNSYLRIKLSEDVSKLKYYYKKMYTKTLNLCYDLNREYYSLSDEERTLIETIISISY